MPFRHAIDLFATAYLPARNFKPRSREEYLTDIRQLAAYMHKAGIRAPRYVGYGNLQSFLATFDAQGLSGATRRRKTASIKAFFRFLKASGFIRTNPAAQIIPPQREYHEPRYLTRKEYRALRAASAAKPRDAALIELLLQTGIRLSEAARLTIDDVEFLKSRNGQWRGNLYIRGKGSKRRMLPLTGKACDALTKWLEQRPDSPVVSLFTTRFEQPMGERAIQRTVEHYLTKAGITDAAVRTLRHTFAVHQLAKGTSIEAVSDMLGHEHVRSTQIYLSLAQQAKRQEIEENAL